MLDIHVCLDSRHIIEKVVAEGHAGVSKAGGNIQCSASTALLRTAYRVIAEQQIGITVSAREKGNLYIEILNYRDDQAEWLKGVTDYLLKGLKDLSEEFPESVNIVIE